MNEDRNRIPYRVSNRRKMLRWITIIGFFYGSIGIALFYLQEKLLFHPKALAKDYVFKFNIPFKEVSIPMNSTDTLSLVQFFPKDTIRKGIVLYFHGNLENINHYAKFASNFTNKGYEVWMPDYPGFGKTIGKLTEEMMYKEATEVYKLAHSEISADSIIVYGKSLGTGVATFVAAKQKCKRLILETPYYSIPSLFSSYAPIYPTSRMSHFKFPVGEYLKEVAVPVTIFHGTSDKVVFYSNSAMLKKVLKPGDEFVSIENAGHNNLNDFPLFHEKLDSVLNAGEN
ncbi:MAG: lysophospholipase [Bacteroidota bacterium]|nr:lysophospholipase [Bacteroidota bacterium]